MVLNLRYCRRLISVFHVILRDSLFDTLRLLFILFFPIVRAQNGFYAILLYLRRFRHDHVMSVYFAIIVFIDLISEHLNVINNF